MKRGAKQLEFEKVKLVHGGDHAKGIRRSRRPLDPKRSTHLVLRSTFIDAQQATLPVREADALLARREVRN